MKQGKLMSQPDYGKRQPYNLERLTCKCVETGSDCHMLPVLFPVPESSSDGPPPARARPLEYPGERRRKTPPRLGEGRLRARVCRALYLSMLSPRLEYIRMCVEGGRGGGPGRG